MHLVTLVSPDRQAVPAEVARRSALCSKKVLRGRRRSLRGRRLLPKGRTPRTAARNDCHVGVLIVIESPTSPGACLHGSRRLRLPTQLHVCPRARDDRRRKRQLHVRRRCLGKWSLLLRRRLLAEPQFLHVQHDRGRRRNVVHDAGAKARREVLAAEPVHPEERRPEGAVEHLVRVNDARMLPGAREARLAAESAAATCLPWNGGA